MFNEITKHWHQFRHYPAGERFERYYRSRHESKRSIAKKILLISTGMLIMLVGVVFLVTPGPGLLALLVGAGLIARESLFVSRLFDRLEPVLWRLLSWCKAKWLSLSNGTKILLIGAVIIFSLLSLHIAYNIFYK